jgi:hypothetical protein
MEQWNDEITEKESGFITLPFRIFQTVDHQ